MTDKLTIEQAAAALSVSKGTINNWLKSGVLSALSQSSVNKLIDGGLGGRLTKRANKSSSQASFSPKEYGGSRQLTRSIALFLSEQAWSVGETLYYAIEDLIRQGQERPQNSHFDREHRSLLTGGEKPLSPNKRAPFPQGITQCEDFPGWLYQSLQEEGKKSLKGSYYTPPAVVQRILDDALGDDSHDGTTLFDPGCGTGSFLCAAALRLKSPVHIFGQDLDPTAVTLGRINLMLLFPHWEFTPRIYRGDSLFAPHKEIAKRRFDRIVTNPPWGFRFSQEERKQLKKKHQLKSTESSAHFILAALPSLTPEGRAAFLLPESLLHRECHREIRAALLNRVVSITWFGKLFSKVQSEGFSLLIGRENNLGDPVPIHFAHRSYSLSRKELSCAPLGIWNIFTSPVSGAIFKKFLSQGATFLKGKALFGLGIVTGNNSKTVEPLSTKSPLKKKGLYRPILAGGQISPFHISPTEQQLDYSRPDLQQKAPLSLYDREKIVYRFIATRPILALDKTDSLTLNSVNTLRPEVDLQPEIIVMLFNSTLYGLYFERTFHTLKVLRSQLEWLPIPQLSAKEVTRFTELYGDLADGAPRAMERLDDLVYNTFNISQKEREALERDV